MSKYLALENPKKVILFLLSLYCDILYWDFATVEQMPLSTTLLSSNKDLFRDKLAEKEN